MIEDDHTHMDLVRLSLEKHGIKHDLIHQPDGQSGLNLLTRRAEQAPEDLPDVVLLDLNLPRLNGHEVLQAVKNHETLKAIPVILLSTSNRCEDIAQAFELGANSYVVKPIDFSRFDEVVRELGTYWADLNERYSVTKAAS